MTESKIRILKIGSAPSLSGQSILTYFVAEKDGSIYFRIKENTSRGLFSQEYVAFDRVILLLEKETTVSSSSLHVVFKGRSINSSGFLLAVLKQEGLVQRIDGKKRGYVGRDPAPFIAAMQVLMEKEVVLDASQTPPPKQKKSKKTVTP